MEQELTPSESLKLIETMIGQAKQSFHRNSFYFLLWGVLLIAAMVVNYVMAVNGDARGGYAWAVVGILGGIASWIYGAREGRRQKVSSAMDRVMMWLWLGFLATLLITMMGSGMSGGSMSVGSIIVLTGLPTFITGQLMRFRPLILGGILFWLLGAVSYFVDMQAVALLYIAAMLFGYLVPGYLLKRQEDGLRTAWYPVLHNQLRLAVVSLLVGVESADFNFLLEKTGATRGNLSVQITKLKDAGYVTVKKTFKDNYPNTRCSLSAKGLKAFEKYVQAITDYLGPAEG